VQLKGVDSSAAVGPDGIIYVGAGESLVAFEPTAGKEKWRFLTTGDVESFPTLTEAKRSTGAHPGFPVPRPGSFKVALAGG
jgi:outer membrane protein assembly factor BamB